MITKPASVPYEDFKRMILTNEKPPYISKAYFRNFVCFYNDYIKDPDGRGGKYVEFRSGSYGKYAEQLYKETNEKKESPNSIDIIENAWNTLKNVMIVETVKMARKEVEEFIQKREQEQYEIIEMLKMDNNELRKKIDSMKKESFISLLNRQFKKL